MSFFQRVLSYVANELLVNRLANKCVARVRVAPPGVPALKLAPRPLRSAAFQRFAIRSDAMARELQQQSAAKQAELLAKSREHARALQEKVARAVEEAGPPKN